MFGAPTRSVQPPSGVSSAPKEHSLQNVVFEHGILLPANLFCFVHGVHSRLGGPRLISIVSLALAAIFDLPRLGVVLKGPPFCLLERRGEG